MDLYAPTYILEEFGPENLLSALKSECEHINHLPVRAIDFHVKFSDNQDFNAVAYEMGDSAYTNVSIATVMQLYHHVLLLMGRSELLPQVGEEGLYEGIYRIEHFVTPEICQYDNRYKQIAFYIGPEDPERLKVAELITIFGMEFILFHELGHHVGGHLKFLERKMGVQQLYAQGNSFALDPQSYQMLETDADAIASACLLESISTKIDFYIKSFLNGSGELLPHCIMMLLMTLIIRDIFQGMYAFGSLYISFRISLKLTTKAVLSLKHQTNSWIRFVFVTASWMNYIQKRIRRKRLCLMNLMRCESTIIIFYFRFGRNCALNWRNMQ